MSRSRTASREAGFTLVEMMVVMLIVGGIVGMATLGFRALTATTVRESATKVAGALRFAWDRSAMTGRVVRVAFDIDRGALWLEIEPEQPLSSSVRFLMARAKEEEQAEAPDGGTVSHAGKRRQPDSLLGNESLLAPSSGAIDPTKVKPGTAAATKLAINALIGTAAQPPPPPDFTRLKQTKHGEIKLPGRVHIEWVYTPHQRTKYAQGKAYAYFFPQGQAEKAVVQLADDGGNRYWLWVHPLTGRVKIESGEARIDFADFERRDDEGGKTEEVPQ